MFLLALAVCSLCPQVTDLKWRKGHQGETRAVALGRLSLKGSVHAGHFHCSVSPGVAQLIILFPGMNSKLIEQINYKWFKNKPKNPLYNHEIKVLKNNHSMESRPSGLAPSVGDGLGPGEKGAYAGPSCGKGFAASLDTSLPTGRAQKMPSECKLPRSRSPISVPLWANILNHLT